jgi:large subunit ribosomal protein L25
VFSLVAGVHQSLESYMKVEATTRTLQGTGASRRLRRESRVPAIVYGGKADPISIELDHNAMFHAMRKEAFHSSLLDLEVDGASAGQVLLRDFQLHPFRQIVMHMDFQRVSATEKMHIKVPIHFIGADVSPAVKGAQQVISHPLSEVEIACLPKHLPQFIEIDLSTMEPNGTLHASQLTLPEGVTLITHGSDDPVIATATSPREEKADEPAVADAAPAAAAPAAGAPAGGAAKK